MTTDLRLAAEANDTDLLPAWAVEYPHQGDPRVYHIADLDELEEAARLALGDNRDLYWCESWDEAVECWGGDLDEMAAAGEGYARMAEEKRGVVVRQGEETEWHETEPERSFATRYEDAAEALGHDLSALIIVPDSKLAETLADDSQWNERYGRCGGPAGRAALLKKAGVSIHHLHLAAKANDTARIAELIARGANPNATDEYDQTPLHTAARWGHPAAITALIAMGADVNGGTAARLTPLHLAAEAGPATINTLIELGADPNARDRNRSTPLHHAADRPSSPDAITALIELGANPNARDQQGTTPLHTAATRGTLAGLTTLIEAGADPNARDREGNTPILLAASWNDTPEMIIALVEAGGKLDAADEEGDTALHIAARWGQAAIIRTLIELGAAASARNQDDERPLDLARLTANPHPAAIAALEAGALAAASARNELDNTPDPDTPSGPSM